MACISTVSYVVVLKRLLVTHSKFLRTFAKGLEFAIDLGFHSVIVESDCRAVISKLCSNILDLSDTGLCHPEDMFWVEDASDRIHRLTAADKRFIAPP
ncbi:hypothetical protein V6N13_075813 [Hibiscus sabdariffa]